MDKSNSKITNDANDIGTLESNKANNISILYITFIIIIGLLLLWIIIVIFTRENPIKILKDMTDMAAQIKPVGDIHP